MKCKRSFLFSLILLSLIPKAAEAQAWSGILDPSRAIDWSTAGIPGGIPVRTTICATVNASTYGNGASDATSGIQSALNSCASNQVVSLSAGTFLINSSISVPSNVTLRGQGADQTILNAHGSGDAVISLGSSPQPSAGGDSITAGATAGSTSITVSSASDISVGAYLMITELNDPSFVTINGTEGVCTWCDGLWNGTRARGQIVEVTSVNGTTIGVSPGLYSAYSNTPLATVIPIGAKYAGVEDLQVYANNTGYTTNFMMQGTAYCWLKGVEGNYADGDHVRAFWSFRGVIRDSYFSNAYSHAPGQTDADVFIAYKTSGFLVENNILERLHLSIVTNWGAAGNVFAYNFSLGTFSSTGGQPLMGDFDSHGAHPQFNLWEGNIGGSFYPDSLFGSSSHNTFFRNWVWGTSRYCSPMTGRGSVVCTSPTGYWNNQANRAMQIGQYSTSYNLVGNVVGSAQLNSLMPEVKQVVSPTNRDYDLTAYDYTFGYGALSDAAGSCASQGTCTPYTTALIHGDYANADGSFTWASGVTQTLPASFYLSAKPNWWPSSTPWPPIGPDVTAGPGPGAHAYAIPAQVCYESVMGGTDGTGSPLAFNADACWLGFSLSKASGGSTSSTITAGQPATYNLQVNPGVGFSGAVNLICSGAPLLASCSVPSSVNISGTSPAPFTVTVSTTARGAAPLRLIRGPDPSLPQTLLLIAVFLVLLLGSTAIASRSKSGLRWATAGMALGLVTLLAACGGGGSSSGGGGGNPGTPAGTYTLTVTGTQQSISHTLTLTLTVN